MNLFPVSASSTRLLPGDSLLLASLDGHTERRILPRAYCFFHVERAPDPETWFVLCGLTVVGWGAALLIFGRYRRYVAYWL